MPTPVRLLSVAEYDALETARRSGAKNGSKARHDYFEPGMGYYATWFYDPLGWDKTSTKMQMDRERGLEGKTFLSVHYWRDWSEKRPPIILFCPNMREWSIDQKSNNGDGWQVTGEDNNLTAMPSIVVPGFHGWLKDGVFSDDIEGRGPNGVKES